MNKTKTDAPKPKPSGKAKFNTTKADKQVSQGEADELVSSIEKLERVMGANIYWLKRVGETAISECATFGVLAGGISMFSIWVVAIGLSWVDDALGNPIWFNFVQLIICIILGVVGAKIANRVVERHVEQITKVYHLNTTEQERKKYEPKD